MRNPFHIDPTGGNIGSYEHPGFAIFKILQGSGTLVLATVRMNSSSGNLGLGQLSGHAVGPVFGTGKDEDGVKIVIFQ